MNNQTRQEIFVSNLFPWIMGGVMAFLYLLTIGHGITLANLGVVSQLAGWDWPQNNLPPITLLLTYPLRCLPVSVLPLVLNMFTAAVGALTLGLLARSVALLPHDRTHAQRERERSEHSKLTIPIAWLPPLLAVLACGLQLTFWECSVDGTGKILDVLLFAYPIRCLLEFRIDGRQSWLTKAALVYGLGMANHWLMVFLLPAFLLSLLWLKGVGFFNLGFLCRMAVAGLLGAAFCLLLPLAQSFGAGAPETFGEALRMFFIGQKATLTMLPLKTLWVLGLTSLLPVAVLAVRWATSFGDNSPLGEALAAFMFHLVHGVLLALCLWGMFDSPLSPRAFCRQSPDLHSYFTSQPWLPFYYLAALAVGYFSGYFLLLFDSKAKASRHDRNFKRLLNTLVPAGVWACLLMVPLGLISKNYAYIQSMGGRAMSQLGFNLVEPLPKNNAAANGVVVLSDDQQMLLLAEATIRQRKTADKYVFVNTAMLPRASYHNFLRAKHPKFWNVDLGNNPATNEIVATQLISILKQQAQDRQIWYLHPSFGYYFEHFYTEPHDLLFQLHLYPPNLLLPPPLSAESAADTTAFWKMLDPATLTEAARRLPPTDLKPRGATEKLFNVFKIKPETDSQSILVGAYYSRSLNAWGVASQRRGDLTQADWCFRRAIELNPHNIVAKVNAACNRTLQTGRYQPFELTSDFTDKLSQYRNADQMLGVNGPFDEPRFCYPRGVLYLQTGLYRQAAQEFTRIMELSPDDLGAYIWLGYIYNIWQMPDETLALMNTARSLPAAVTNKPVELVANEATAYFIKKDFPAAERILEAALQENPDNEKMESTAIRLFMAFHSPSNALKVIDRQLQSTPDDLNALNNQGVIQIQLGRYEAAIAPLSRVLTEQPTNYVARLNRAIAQLQCDRLTEARQDYETLVKLFPSAHQLYYGLGEIAYRRKERAEAIKYFEQYLVHAPAETDEARMIRQRLTELKSPSP